MNSKEGGPAPHCWHCNATRPHLDGFIEWERRGTEEGAGQSPNRALFALWLAGIQDGVFQIQGGGSMLRLAQEGGIEDMPTMKSITPGQIKKIHTLKSALGLDDASYRQRLGAFGVESSKDLDFHQASLLLEDWETKAVASGVWEKRPLTRQHENLKGRPGMATPAQLRMIEGIWGEVSRRPDVKSRKAALRTFLEKITGISDLRFLDSEGAGKILVALKEMKKSRTRKKKAGKNSLNSKSAL